MAVVPIFWQRGGLGHCFKVKLSSGLRWGLGKLKVKLSLWPQSRFIIKLEVNPYLDIEARHPLLVSRQGIPCISSSITIHHLTRAKQEGSPIWFNFYVCASNFLLSRRLWLWNFKFISWAGNLKEKSTCPLEEKIKILPSNVSNSWYDIITYLFSLPFSSNCQGIMSFCFLRRLPLSFSLQ